ncbi:MAG: glutathione S-transferase family protein [Alphaproteobacteria bacterium]|nr:glutathione S-transferase family protein [Alphaproteobacteria bacterium]
MSGSYRLFGSETSAYSTKMRSYLRYKGVEHDWRPRTQASEEELRSLAKFATLPVLVTASGFAVHDTTPMIEALEADSPEPSATPADPALAFLACVLEEYADTWLAKAAFHYRWTRKKDQRLAAQRAVENYYVDTPPEDRKAAEDGAIVRMLDQLRLMQLDGDLGAATEKSFKRFVKLLDDHLRKHLYLFGGRPSIADFAIAGQLIQMLKDPTPAKIIEKDGEFVQKWCEFLADPKPGGPFESFDDLKETLAPIFASELVASFLPWAAENLENSLAGNETFEVTLGKDVLKLAPLKSAARSFRELRRKFVSAQTIEALKAFTDETGATVYLLRPPMAERVPREGRRPRRDEPQTASADGEETAADAGEGDEAVADASAPASETGEGEGVRRKRRRRRRGGAGRRSAAESASTEAADDDAGDDDAAVEDEAHESDSSRIEASADADVAEASSSDEDAPEPGLED